MGKRKGPLVQDFRNRIIFNLDKKNFKELKDDFQGFADQWCETRMPKGLCYLPIALALEKFARKYRVGGEPKKAKVLWELADQHSPKFRQALEKWKK